MSAPVEFGSLEPPALAALVFDLAAQLHIERTARLALQSALLANGVVTQAQIERIAGDASFRRQSGEAADLAVRRLLRTLSESSDERSPLRAEAPESRAGESP